MPNKTSTALIAPVSSPSETLFPGPIATDPSPSPSATPIYREMDFNDEAECIRFIISTNLHRRHLTDEQRDVIGAQLVTMQQGDPAKCGVTVNAAAEMVSSTPARIERARTIVRADPELADKVVRGEISKGKALKEIKRRAKPQTDPDDNRGRDGETQVRGWTGAHV